MNRTRRTLTSIALRLKYSLNDAREFYFIFFQAIQAAPETDWVLEKE